MIALFSCKFNSFLSCYRFILYFDYCSFTGVDSVSLQGASLLYVHGFIMMSPLFKAVLRFCTKNHLFIYHNMKETWFSGISEL